MRHFLYILALSLTLSLPALAAGSPWDNGDLRVSANGRFLQFANGKPFFWLADTGWLLPERLNRDEAEHYLASLGRAGYNVVQVQVINAIPSFNAYGQMALDRGFDFSQADRPGVYGYWNHMDYIVDRAAAHGIYVAMVCIWGGMVKRGDMNATQARAYGSFLARRYGRRPNIVWVMGGDIRGDIHPEVWEALATTIKAADRRHLMTFHPRGRHTSAQWFNSSEWLDFNMFQSGHRRYNQRMGDKRYPIAEGTEEDNWMYVDSAWSHRPVKPVLDGEPSYEGIPQGLHSGSEPRWTAADCRRYAYWAVFAGACGHTYGNSAIMQMAKPGTEGAYSADPVAKPWYVALGDPGFRQMQYLKRLMLALPYFERVPDQRVILNNGTRYDRLAATRGKSYLLVYNHTGRDMTVDLTRISGARKRVWWMDPTDGHITFLGTFDSRVTTFRYHARATGVADGVLIAADEKMPLSLE